MQPIIEVNHLSKKYQLGEKQLYLTLRDTISTLLTKKDNSKKRDFWALKDVSFEIMPGEVVGIIGHNGAGKSTLLKIISRITYPTSGQAYLRGRVASLLEVGTGFSPELTGRENIYLNGAILGMSRKEISRKFEEIVSFAETEKFLDTQVKYYSSGMYMRLAFAVAAHLEPDILLVDEVLAVGDAEFQQKCLGKMEEVRTKEGRTILFVSHNMRMVEQLCNRCILLDKGMVVKTGDTNKIISYYLNKQKITHHEMILPRDPKKDAQITKIVLLNADNQPRSDLPISEDFFIQVSVKVKRQMRKVLLSVYFYSQGELLLFSTESDKTGQLPTYKPGTYQFKIRIPAFLFEFGNYTFDVAFQRPGQEVMDRVSGIGFEVINQNNPRGLITNNTAHDRIAVILDYETKKLS